MEISPADQDVLASAVRRLESLSLAGRLAALAGKPVGLVQRALPATASMAVAKVANRALERALDVALFSLRNRRIIGGRKLHSGLACTSGAIGGAFGLTALPIELPISTTIILRAIAVIARQEGEDFDDLRARLACLEVFALGGSSARQQGEETDYFAVRAMLARGLVEVADFIVDKGAMREGAPLLVRSLTQIASRFGVVVSQKIAAQSVVVLGALGGAAINLAFVEHFQDVAQGHFTVRRLERAYGPEPVRAEYERLKADFAAAAKVRKSELQLLAPARKLPQDAPMPGS